MELTTKARMADQAKTLAQSYELVNYNSVFYMPTNFNTGEPGPCGPLEKVWQPVGREEIRRWANARGNILFAGHGELSSFELLLKQLCHEVIEQPSGILLQTNDGLRVLTNEGDLVEPDGKFRPNYIKVPLNTKQDDKDEVWKTIVEWVDSEDDAKSLMYHLATALAPTWSAVKYVILIGEGRNGKSVLLSMLQDLFGLENISNVSRQKISEESPVCLELNNKLLNLVFDGKMEYIKDSALEKTLVAGEPGKVRLLYESILTTVQTNALFIEALNQEPKTRDKSTALQKRLARFRFPNTYPRNLKFERHMRSKKLLGAFLSLLIDHFVKESEVIEKLSLSEGSLELQVEQNIVNQPIFQFVSHLIESDEKWIEKFEKEIVQVDPLVDSFMAWRLNEGYGDYTTMDVRRAFSVAFNVKWKSIRENGKVSNKRCLMGPKQELQAMLDLMKGKEEDAVQSTAVVED